jgi:hypothetical protein
LRFAPEPPSRAATIEPNTGYSAEISRSERSPLENLKPDRHNNLKLVQHHNLINARHENLIFVRRNNLRIAQGTRHGLTVRKTRDAELNGSCSVNGFPRPALILNEFEVPRSGVESVQIALRIVLRIG